MRKVFLPTHMPDLNLEKGEKKVNSPVCKMPGMASHLQAHYSVNKLMRPSEVLSRYA